MAYLTYIDLVNALRDRLNEVHLTTGNFNSVVGFDQFCKDAINYAYHDILNAEMEWPFLHQAVTQKTTPGVQFYTYSPASAPYTIKEIDWDGFYISGNQTVTSVVDEAHTIPSSAPFLVLPTNIANWTSDQGVKFTVGSTSLTAVSGDPSAGQYTIISGTYYFNAADIGKAIQISYQYTTPPSEAFLIASSPLSYIDYDYWRNTYLARDFSAISANSYGIPINVFKTQQQGQFGITPVPDKIYILNFEAWLDGVDMSATTDTTLLPSRYNQIIIDGAQKYCYEFREDPQLAQMADARFKAGIARMRIELINRDATMQSGFYWYPRGTSYTNNAV